MKSNKPKIVLIGTGKVGSLAAQHLLQQNLGEIFLVNRDHKKTEGIALDIASALPQFHQNLHVGKIKDSKNADIIIISAGPTATAGQKLDDLATVGYKVIKSIVVSHEINPQALVIIVTTPIDECSQYFQSISGHDKKMVIGFGGTLDVSRMKYLISKDTGTPTKEIECYYIGKHGGPGIPVYYKKVSDEDSITQFSKYYFKEVASRTGASTLYGPAYQLALLVKNIVNDNKTPQCVSAWHEDHGLFVTWPTILNTNGVVDLADIKLTSTQKKQLDSLLSAEKSKRNFK